jgi:hypothetical protein
MSLIMEVEQKYVLKFFVEERMKGARIIGRQNKYYHLDALQRTQVYRVFNPLLSISVSR